MNNELLTLDLALLLVMVQHGIAESGEAPDSIDLARRGTDATAKRKALRAMLSACGSSCGHAPDDCNPDLVIECAIDEALERAAELPIGGES